MPLSPGHHTLLPNIHCTVLQASKDGPTAIVQAGIHGDEIAGVHALQELLEEGVLIDRGRVLIIPVMNPAAYRRRTRAREGGADLNRCFPGDPDSPIAEERLAHRFMTLVREEQPALVATLHESKKRYDPNVHPSFGQTLVYGVRPCPSLLSDAVDQLNTRLDGPNEHWATHYFPVSTSSTEVIVEDVGCIGTCVETWMGFSERRRIDMQKDVVRTLLLGLGIRIG